MGGTSDEEALFRARTERMDVSNTEIGVTIRASAAPSMPADVDPAELPRITLDTRGASPIPPERAHRGDLAIVSTLGEGGMGRVHLARQRSLARDVAVKTLKEGASAAVAHALLREARVTGMLEHPGVIPVHALGVDDVGAPMLVMKRVDGVDLSTQLAGEPQSGDRLVTTLETLMQVCRTCEFAHSRRVIHRDIKPENIMTGGFGEVYLLDWGIATTFDAVKDESIVGTPVYMAPEMVLGRKLDARTDVYLLGATLHEVLTGRPRHGGKTMMEVARNALLSEPVAYGDDVPEELARLCNRATSKDPARRPESAAAFREELALFLRHRAARAIADAARERLAALETLLAASKDAPRDLARAYRLVAEARFGLAQSIEQDPNDADTNAAMRRCTIAAIELELRQGHVDSADALLRDLDPPDPDLSRRLDERREQASLREKHHARLVDLERDLDPTQNAAQRTIPMIVLAALLVGIGTVLMALQPTVTPKGSLVAGTSALLVFVTGIGLLRKRLLSNAFNRRSVAMLTLALGLALVNRLVGFGFGRGVAQVLSEDLLLFATVMATAAITLVRNLWICSVMLLLGWIAANAWPERITMTFPLSAFLSLVVATIVLRRAR